MGITLQRALDRGQFVSRNMPGVIFAILPALKFVIRAGGMRAELSPLHGRNGRNLFQQAGLFSLVHILPITLGIQTMKASRKTPFEGFCLTPDGGSCPPVNELRPLE